MWARSHTSGLMIGSTWRSMSAAERWPTRSSVRRRAAAMASTISACIGDKAYRGRPYADVNGRPTDIVAARSNIADGDNPTLTRQSTAWSARRPVGTLRGGTRTTLSQLRRRHRVHANTFAARAGRWSAQHRKTAIWGWIAFVIVAFVIGGALGVKKPTDYIGPGDSGRADQLALDHFPKDQTESVLIQAPTGGSARDASVRKAVGDTIAAVRGKDRVAEVKSPYAAGNENQIAKDGRSVLVTFKVRGDADRTADAIDPVVAAVERVKAQNSGVFVGQFGDASADKALSKSFSDDFKKAEKLSLPITLIILIVAFGALVAVGIPLLLGLSAVMATLGLVALPSQIVPMDDMISSIILLIGLAVGV